VLRIKLDFLDPGQQYSVTLYEDAPESHYVENREAYRIRHSQVRRNDTLEAPMAPGGGHCIYLEPMVDADR
jgi:alpha-glucosidase